MVKTKNTLQYQWPYEKVSTYLDPAYYYKIEIILIHNITIRNYDIY